MSYQNKKFPASSGPSGFLILLGCWHVYSILWVCLGVLNLKVLSRLQALLEVVDAKMANLILSRLLSATFQDISSCQAA